MPASMEPAHMDEVKSVLVISWTKVGNWQEICYTSQENDYEEYVKTDTKGTFALRVRGDSMEPKFHEGDIVVIYICHRKTNKKK
ncbi:MAG: S24 family peptidase [Candidatus Scalindua sp.]|nr:S24 family peptidase [Candidatus Scalindua sp.]